MQFVQTLLFIHSEGRILSHSICVLSDIVLEKGSLKTGRTPCCACVILSCFSGCSSDGQFCLPKLCGPEMFSVVGRLVHCVDHS